MVSSAASFLEGPGFESVGRPGATGQILCRHSVQAPDHGPLSDSFSMKTEVGGSGQAGGLI